MAEVMNNKTPLVFKVTRQSPELVAPAKPTPYEILEVSDIDDQARLWIQTPEIHFYRSEPKMFGLDPAKVIKEALSKALVPYYPLAGRLREKAGKKLAVECTGEGILFVEAKADVRLDEFSDDQLYAPIPCMEELLFDVPSSNPILNSPLLLFQVTRLECGGFILAHKINNVMADGTGVAQIINAVAELARGAQFLSVEPVWERHLLRARTPPKVTCVHREFEQIPLIPLPHDLVFKRFFFGSTEIVALRRFLPSHLKSSSTFEVLSAVIWRSRTMALELSPNDEVRLRIYVNARPKFKDTTISAGYYGNVVATPNAICTSRELTDNPVGYAIELVKAAKNIVDEEYMKSMVDFLVINGKPKSTQGNTFSVSDLRNIDHGMVNFGWGPPVPFGPAKGWMGPTPGHGSFLLASKNSKGESGTLVAMYLPSLAMDKFVKEMKGYLAVDLPTQFTSSKSGNDKASLSKL